MTNAAPGPLDGVKVLDLTQQIAGPYCTKLFADYGAEVIKIEPPDGGDPTRRMAPFLHDEPNLEKSGLFLHLNTNKKSVTLDIETQAGRSVLLQLARDADIVVESFTPDFMPSLDLDYDGLRGGESAHRHDLASRTSAAPGPTKTTLHPRSRCTPSAAR